jgi:hypothetical protein
MVQKEMTNMPQKSAQLFGSLLGLILLITVITRAQNASPKPADREMERVQAMISEAKKEAEQFSKSGGQTVDANNPNLKWAETLWRYRRKHPGTPATTLATTEALRLLVRADRITEIQAKADTLKLTDAAWKQVLTVLLGAAIRKKDYTYFISKAETLSQNSVDPEVRAKARFVIGEGYWRKGDIDQARIAFQTVVTQYPTTSYGEEAEGNLREIEFLNVGQPAPFFERKTIDGDPFSLGSLKGQVVVLKFWGTY